MMCHIFLTDGIIIDIPTEIYPTYPHILLTTTYFSSFLKSRLVVRRRRSDPPLTTSRFYVLPKFLNGIVPMTST